MLIQTVKILGLGLALTIVSGLGQGVLAQTQPQTAPTVKIWTSDVVSDERSPNAARELKPITLIAARNGTFSGKVIVESSAAITGLRATSGPLTGPGGVIAAENVQLRYAAAWQGRGEPRGLDILLESPPEVTPKNGPALLPVWVTIAVPRDAKAGNYSGVVSVQPQGIAAVKVPLQLQVQDWTLPDPQDYRTCVDFVQSPDTLALQYKVPLWSEKHWELIDRSFRLLSPTGARSVYVPLICQTNLGNEQSMVKWIKKGANQYDYDFSAMDRYLDSAQKNLGQPKLVILQVWDICMSMDALKRGLWTDAQGGGTVKKRREELLGKGPRVTVLDPATKQTSVLTLPRYDDPASKALWGPMLVELRQHMAKRGLDKSLMLGLMPDLWPTKEEVAFWTEIAGAVPWVIHAHAGGEVYEIGVGKKGLYGITDIGYAAYVSHLEFNVNPDKGRMYGWRNPALLTHYYRANALNGASLLDMREFPIFNITGGQRGVGRMGADMWRVPGDKPGDPPSAVWARYPENNWRNLDIENWFLASGPDGAVATARLVSLKEGVQECEARIFLEDALLDPAKKAKVGDELTQRCQAALDEHHWAMWKTLWTNDPDLRNIGHAWFPGEHPGIRRSPSECLWNILQHNGQQLPNGSSPSVRTMAEEARKGQEWFAQGWQERERKLFGLAGEVAAKLGQQ